MYEVHSAGDVRPSSVKRGALSRPVSHPRTAQETTAFTQSTT